MAKDPRDVVRVHYTGYKSEGKVFDTSIFKNRSKEQQEMMRKQNPDGFDEKGAPKETDEPAKFPLNRVIRSRSGFRATWLTVRVVQAVTSAPTRRSSSMWK